MKNGFSFGFHLEEIPSPLHPERFARYALTPALRHFARLSLTPIPGHLLNERPSILLFTFLHFSLQEMDDKCNIVTFSAIVTFSLPQCHP